MTQPHETAFPRLKADPTDQDLAAIYTLTPAEIAFIDGLRLKSVPRAAAFLYLKLFQRLGYFIRLRDVPALIRNHVLAQTGYPKPPNAEQLRVFDASTRRTALTTALRR